MKTDKSWICYTEGKVVSDGGHREQETRAKANDVSIQKRLEELKVNPFTSYTGRGTDFDWYVEAILGEF